MEPTLNSALQAAMTDEMMKQLLCKYTKQVCIKALTCTGYCGKITVNKVNEKGEVIDSRCGL